MARSELDISPEERDRLIGRSYADFVASLFEPGKEGALKEWFGGKPTSKGDSTNPRALVVPTTPSSVDLLTATLRREVSIDEGNYPFGITGERLRGIVSLTLSEFSANSGQSLTDMQVSIKQITIKNLQEINDVIKRLEADPNNKFAPLPVWGLEEGVGSLDNRESVRRQVDERYADWISGRRQVYFGSICRRTILRLLGVTVDHDGRALETPKKFLPQQFGSMRQWVSFYPSKINGVQLVQVEEERENIPTTGQYSYRRFEQIVLGHIR